MNRILWTRLCTSTLRRNMCSQPARGPPPAATTTSAGAAAAAPVTGTSNHNISPQYRPSELQKFILVWTKKYKSKEEIPKFVSPDLIQKSQSQARIKIANVLILLTALASVGAILSGKAAAKRGESVHKMNKDWHQQYQDNYDKKAVAQPVDK